MFREINGGDCAFGRRAHRKQIQLVSLTPSALRKAVKLAEAMP